MLPPCVAFCFTLPLVSAPAPTTYRPADVRVWFSPQGGCTEAIVSSISAAKVSVRVQAYAFTSAPIAAAVIDAHWRGLDVQVILDESQRTENYSPADLLLHAGIPTVIDARHAIAHNKIIVLDGATVLTGSFNFTKSAEEKNAENLLMIRDAALAARYVENWAEHREHSEAYEGKADRTKAR